MRHHHTEYPRLSRTDWYAVADAHWAAETAGEVSVFSAVANRLRAAFGLDENARSQSDPRDELLKEFVQRTRRARRPADDLSEALLSNGFSADQITALALLSIH
ncbi:MAG: hypothetical protein V4610_11275 [Pseudomonadota bacterium]|jgi:hypothetical protein